MIVKKIRKNGKVSITSSYFDDIRTYRMSLSDSKQSDYVSKKWRREKGRDFKEIELATAIQCLILAKLGIADICEFQKNLRDDQFENYIFNYGPCKEYTSYEDLCARKDELEAEDSLSAKELTELEHVKAEIADIDRFVETNCQVISETETFLEN